MSGSAMCRSAGCLRFLGHYPVPFLGGFKPRRLHKRHGQPKSARWRQFCCLAALFDQFECAASRLGNIMLNNKASIDTTPTHHEFWPCHSSQARGDRARNDQKLMPVVTPNMRSAGSPTVT